MSHCSVTVWHPFLLVPGMLVRMLAYLSHFFISIDDIEIIYVYFVELLYFLLHKKPLVVFALLCDIDL